MSSLDVDVLIVGAGISGIGAAHHLAEQRPERSFMILESQDGFGGTWRTHRYPGIRSDSDLYTFGYRFKPWVGPPIATGEQIMAYLDEVVAGDRLSDRVLFGHRVVGAEWSSDEQRWSVRAVRGADGATVEVNAAFLWMCQGYYRHEEGYTPTWPGMERFTGRIVHPQTWPEDLEYAGRRVVVIGSGATAATLVPALSPHCAHVTMLQRSPTFFIARDNANDVADMLRLLEIPEEWIHEIVRRKILFDMELLYQVARDYPDFAREELLRPIRELLGDRIDVDRHFNPRYRPWQQRIAALPGGDLFHEIDQGRVSVVTDEIDSFVDEGIRLASGEVLECDLIVTATGFDVSVLGDVDFRVDGAAVDFSETVTYRGMMFTGVPNMVWVFGYFRNSWTLRVDLIGDFVCRLLGHLDELGAASATPVLPAGLDAMPRLDWMDPENFNPGYLARSMRRLPRQGDRDPWRHTQDYWTEKVDLPAADLDDGALVYDKRRA